VAPTTPAVDVKSLHAKIRELTLENDFLDCRISRGSKIYPCLLRGMQITRLNQAGAMDITYIPMARGFVYLAVVLDGVTRRVLSWRLSITMEAAFCVETLGDALARHDRSDVFNIDQGSHSLPQHLPACLPKRHRHQHGR
jgi:putative transposase